MAKLSPVFNDQTIDANGDPYVGAQLFTYAAGSSTKQAVYTDAAGTIPHSNPITLDSLGFPEQAAIWIPEGISVKFVLAPPTDTDPPTSPIKTIDNVQGVNDAGATTSEWQASGVTPTYIGASSFSLVGDQTTAFHKGRRVQFTTSGGTVYGKIINSVFTSLTTVTMLMDGTSALDSGLSVVNLSLLRNTPSALPNPIELLRSTVVANATTTQMWDAAYGEVQEWAGVVTITALPNAPRPGAQRQVYPAVGTIITNGGNISVQGNANATAVAGDKWIINAITTTTFYVEVIKRDGRPAMFQLPITVRQSVQYGPTTGTPAVSDLIPQSQVGATLATGVTLKCSTAATLFSVANGFNSDGSPNNLNWLASADIVVPNLTASVTNYIWVDTVAQTAGFVTVADGDQSGGTIPVTNNRYTFDYSAYKMYLGNGATAAQSNRIIVAEVDTNGTVITAIRCRAYRGYADTGWFAVAVSQLYTKNHNVGSPYCDLDLFWNSTATDDGARNVPQFSIGGGSAGASRKINKNTAAFGTYDGFTYSSANAPADSVTSGTGFYRATVRRKY